MNCTESTTIESPNGNTPLESPEEREGTILFPMGLFGFEQHKEYTLLTSPEEAPFLWMKTREDPNLAFLVISPGEFMRDYEPEINEEDTAFLGLQDSHDALVLNIVTIHADGKATANLKGPVVVNRRTLVGKQIIPVNVSRFSLQHSIQPFNRQESDRTGPGGR